MGCGSRVKKNISRETKKVEKVFTNARDDTEDFVTNARDDVEDVVSDARDDVEDFVSEAVDDIEDFGRDVEEFVEDTYKYVVEPVVDFVIEVSHDILEYSLDVVDFVLDEGFGISGSMDFLYDVNDGLEYMAYGIVEGDEKMILMGAMIAVSIVLTIVSFGAASPLLTNVLWGVTYLMGGAGSAFTLAAIGYVALGVYTLYSIALPLAELGKALSEQGMGAVGQYAEEVRSAMNLDYTNSYVNGMASLWMAGGILYDSPRAGDVLFNVTGSLNTTKFLGLQDLNGNPDIIKTHTNPEVFKMLDVKAGEEYFSI